MEVTVEVFAEDYLRKLKRATNKAYVTYVSVDSDGKPREVPGLILETDEQKKEYAEAEKRRAQRLKRRQTEQNR
jgi:acyl-CoA hydrolase